MITVDFWRSIGQGWYDPDCGTHATMAIIATGTYRFAWMAALARWSWDYRKDYMHQWSEVVVVTDTQQKQKCIGDKQHVKIK